MEQRQAAPALFLRGAIRWSTDSSRGLPTLAELRTGAQEQVSLPDRLFARRSTTCKISGQIRFFDEGRSPLDHNPRERDLCGVVFGRKNLHDSKSVRCTQLAKTLYSIVESSQPAGIPEHVYLSQADQHALQALDGSLQPRAASP